MAPAAPATPDAYAPVTTPRDVADAAPAPRRRFKLVIGAVVLVGVVLVAVGAVVYTFRTKVQTHASDILTNIQQSPGLKITVTAKRESMRFNGQSSAQFYVVPRPGDAFSFDAVVAQAGPEVVERYLLLDGRAYWSVAKDDNVVASGCLEASQLPPVELVASSVATASVVDAVTGDAITVDDCPDGKLLQLTFAGDSFVFCNSPSNRLTKAASADLDVAVEYLRDASLLPSMDPPTGVSCPVVVGPSVPAPAATLVQTGRAISSALFGGPRVAAVSKSSCACKSTPKPCLFVHGVGETASMPLQNSYPDMWGSIEEHAPCCTSVKFARFETTLRGWDNADLQNQFCDAARSVAGTRAGAPIDNLLLVAHSMGNLIAGSAVASGKCAFGNGVTWVSIAGPLQGSKTANALEEKCASGGGAISFKSLLGSAGLCPITAAYVSLKHETTVDDGMRAKFAAAQAVRQKYASRVMCGTSSMGLATWKGVGLAGIGKLSGHDSNHDGVVDLPSCAVGIDRRKFGADAASSLHYEASINHLDTSFRNGDGWWGADRKPIKWFECSL
ncbi:hypothetical protein ACHHYP_00995 [Achlya hypogyna]|uniref:Uncharacterized protein n=1 Tax=Achlya hypogyna TaxID=1202772 RepID=A0A1V9Z9Z0_ACHHY|nr:hypothetical protein ACHHYP_00995 [Achlya hypogyna]